LCLSVCVCVFVFDQSGELLSCEMRSLRWSIRVVAVLCVAFGLAKLVFDATELRDPNGLQGMIESAPFDTMQSGREFLRGEVDRPTASVVAVPSVVPPALKLLPTPHGECTAANRGDNDFGNAKGRGVLISFFCNSTDIKLYRDLGRYDNGKFAFYLPEVVGLCESIAKNSPGLPISVVTDRPELVRTIKACKFDNIIENTVKLKDTSWAEKPASLQQSPYAQTLFLDVDTLVCGDLRPIFNFLTHYDIVFAKEPESESEAAKNDKKFRATRMWEVNSGVMAFNNTACMRKMWKDVAKVQAGGDQHYIKLLGDMSVLQWHHEIRPLVIGQEWNVRIGPGSMAQFINGPAKVLHFKKQMEALKSFTCEKINAYPYYRLFSQRFKSFQVPIWDTDWNKLKQY